MDQKLTAHQLMQKYPKIFKSEYSAICVGDGWFDLIDQVCDCIQNYIDCGNLDGKPQLEISYIKEKYGELRFDDYGGDDYTSGMLWFAMYQSRRTCEVCGQAGTQNEPPAWIKVRCDKHSDKPKKLINKIRKYIEYKLIHLFAPIRRIKFKIDNWLYLNDFVEDKGTHIEKLSLKAIIRVLLNKKV